MFLCLVLFVIFSASACAIQDYCSLNTFSSNGTSMQFTKEPSVKEYAIEGKFKGLHCCARGYRSIEWYKDGKPYPWPLMVSSLILYPESANQTVYTQHLTKVDSGNYTCLLRDDSVVHYHTIQLAVLESVPEDPQVTYVSQDTQVALGHSLRLFCEAFAGRVDLPDAHNEAVWRKEGHNASLDNDPRIRQETVSREDSQTFGTYLTISDVRREDYGDYTCIISKPGRTIERHVSVSEKIKVEYLNPNPVPVAKMLLCISAILFLILVALVLNLQYGLPLRVRFKDSFGPLEENDGKTSDVLVLHSSKDSEIALGVLLPTLETKYKYQCSSRELPTNTGLWFGDLQDDALRSRRLLALLSPAVLHDQWDTAAIYRAVKQLQALGTKLTLVTLKALPSHEHEVKNSSGETLGTLLRAVDVVHWERCKEDRFWLALRLRLPPKRGPGGAPGLPRLTGDSDESLDDFV